MTDWGALYREHVADVSALAADLTDEQLATTVPATPAWTVHEVLAHMAGGASDAAHRTGWTAPRARSGRRGTSASGAELPVAELVAELQSNQDAVAASAGRQPVPGAGLRHLGAPRRPARGARQAPAGRAPVAARRSTRCAPRLDPRAVRGGVRRTSCLRGLFSRRSRAQMQAWGTALSAEELDELCIFGPREDDQPVPA